jgi:hypothetical protein
MLFSLQFTPDREQKTSQTLGSGRLDTENRETSISRDQKFRNTTKSRPQASPRCPTRQDDNLAGSEKRERRIHGQEYKKTS